MTNVGSPDRVVRAILGFILIVAPFLPFTMSFFGPLGMWKLVIVVAGIVLLGTAALRFCPLYAILGLNTCPVERR